MLRGCLYSLLLIVEHNDMTFDYLNIYHGEDLQAYIMVENYIV